MFSAWCPILQTCFLHSPSEIVRVVKAGNAIRVDYRCLCGDVHEWTTGRDRDAPSLDRCA